MGREPPQPPQHHRDLGTEDAAVRVAFVDHHIPQPAEEPRPPLMRTQHAGVQHVGIGEDPSGIPTYPLPDLGGGVAVVGGRVDIAQAAGMAQPRGGAELIGAQRLGRRQIQSGRAGVPLQVGQHGKLISQGLSRCRAGADHDVLALLGCLCGLDLMRPRRVYTRFPQRLDQVGGGPGGPLGELRRSCAEFGHVRDTARSIGYSE